MEWLLDYRDESLGGGVSLTEMSLDVSRDVVFGYLLEVQFISKNAFPIWKVELKLEPWEISI
jgi:hypothetical protein